MRLAVISCGTNSCRLLIARRESSGFEIEHHDIRGTRLGEGIGRSGALSDDAMARTLAAVGEFNVLARLTDGTFLIGTQALRAAKNAEAFAKAARAQTCLELRVLTPQEEARASFAGAMWALDRAGFDHAGGACVVDVGGGSTEFAWAAGANGPVETQSIPIGAVGLTEVYLVSDPPEPDELTTCRVMVHLALDGVKALNPAASDSRAVLVAVGGTANTAARLMDAYLYDSKVATLTQYDLVGLFGLTSALPVAERRRLHGLPQQRADIFPAGLIILDEIMTALQEHTMMIAESDLLLGYLMLNA